MHLHFMNQTVLVKIILYLYALSIKCLKITKASCNICYMLIINQ